MLTAHGTLAGEGVVSVAVNAHTNKRGWSSLRGGTTLPSAVSKACGCDGAKGTTSADASASEAQAFSLLGFFVLVVFCFCFCAVADVHKKGLYFQDLFFFFLWVITSALTSYLHREKLSVERLRVDDAQSVK